MSSDENQKPIDRRQFLKASLVGAAAVSMPEQPQRAGAAARSEDSSPTKPGIIDTNVNLFDWPFRALKYRRTKELVAKLRKHRIIQGWAGSFEALLSKDMNGVNTRLAAECRQHSDFLIPFGSVNLAWPDWEEDLRRCAEVHQMPGVRIYPGYQPFDLDHPAMGSLVRKTAERGLILQVVFGMEDPRVHHPIIKVGPVTLAPLLKWIQETPKAKIQLLHFAGTPSDTLSKFIAQPNTYLEISRLEGNGAVGRLIGSIEGLPSAMIPIDRILFGSHFPFFPIETALLKLVESPLDARQLQAIMHGNARQLRIG